MRRTLAALILPPVTWFAISEAASMPAATTTSQAPACAPTLVHCNYAHLYSGTIRIVTVDSVASPDHIVHNDGDVLITVAKGVASCRGQHREQEKTGFRGKWNSEMKGTGSSAGPGMLAIEFEMDQGRPVYVLTAVCPTPRMIRNSIELNYGVQQSDTFPGNPAEWNSSERIVDPQTATSIGMTPLTGTQTLTRSEPENNAGGYTRVTWDLKRP